MSLSAASQGQAAVNLLETWEWWYTEDYVSPEITNLGTHQASPSMSIYIPVAHQGFMKAISFLRGRIWGWERFTCLDGSGIREAMAETSIH